MSYLEQKRNALLNSVASVSEPTWKELADQTISGDLRYDELLTLRRYIFYGCVNIDTFYGKSVTKFEESCFRGSTNLKEIVLPSLSTKDGNNQFYQIGIELSDLGVLSALTYGMELRNKNNFSKLILRKTNAISTLDATSTLNNTQFDTSGGKGKVYVPTSLKSTYESASNWSALTSTTFINLEDSRFADTDWYEKRNSTCSLDGNEIKVLDNETVAIFKTTENIEHLYENGIEVADTTELVKDRTFTSSI